LDLDKHALDAIVKHGKQKQSIAPENKAERQCFDVLSVIDYMSGHVQGSNAA
ncbi:hypothetical protein CERSUDRAFT_59326, partial [Gelatoporia subvermispora B]